MTRPRPAVLARSEARAAVPCPGRVSSSTPACFTAAVGSSQRETARCLGIRDVPANFAVGAAAGEWSFSRTAVAMWMLGVPNNKGSLASEDPTLGPESFGIDVGSSQKTSNSFAIIKGEWK